MTAKNIAATAADTATELNNASNDGNNYDCLQLRLFNGYTQSSIIETSSSLLTETTANASDVGDYCSETNKYPITKCVVQENKLPAASEISVYNKPTLNVLTAKNRWHLLTPWSFKLSRNCFKISTLFGTYYSFIFYFLTKTLNLLLYRYTVTGSSDGSKLPSLGKDKGEVAAIRIKARYQSIEILPLHMYDDLLRFVRFRYLPLCLALEPILGVKAKEDFATALVRIMHEERIAKEFLCDVIMSEVNVLDNEHLMFRGNSLATKAMEAYMKLVADDYLQETLGEFVKSILQSDENCEVDPLKMTNVSPVILEKNRRNLTLNVETAWGKIMDSTYSFPIELREIFDCLRKRLEQANRRDLADTLISSSIFLRFLCPAILSPSLFNLVPEYPSGRAARSLTLIAKTLQTLANFTKFGGKEHYMDFMNEFVDREWDNMHTYLIRISTMPQRIDRYGTTNNAETAVDRGKEIALLYSYLDEVWTNEAEKEAIKNDHRMDGLRKILSKLSLRYRNDFSLSELRNSESHSISDYDNNGVLSASSFAVKTHTHNRSTPATHLNTNDDYVRDEALNDSIAVRQAGLVVQQHRHGQHKTGRQLIDSPNENYTTRNPASSVPVHHHYGTVDDSNAVLNGTFNGYHNMDSSSAATTSSSISRTSTKSYSTTTSNQHPEDDTDSDEFLSSHIRQIRPPRKNKRRVNSTTATTNTNIDVQNHGRSVAPPPPSSGYQSQNHSSSSSNSSSPIERSSLPLSDAISSHTQLKSYAIHTNLPSTSSPPSYQRLPDARCSNEASPSSTVSSGDNTFNFCRSHIYPTSCEVNSYHDCSKTSQPRKIFCYLFRTNPHYGSRGSCGVLSSVGVVKPTLIDISNDNESEIVVAKPVRAGVVADNIKDVKSTNDNWSANDQQRLRHSEHWSMLAEEPITQMSQQEIIEQQKCEIQRLLKENEELKKRVAAQNVGQVVQTSVASVTVDSLPLADSGASEESYGSLSSLNDIMETLPTATHC
uniref:Ras-GAP domain-containing protein n=1 Tax=Syphacia muris TaxID=451379 RepID=A0A0N5A921_9BILA